LKPPNLRRRAHRERLIRAAEFQSMSTDWPIAKLSPLVWVSAFETGDSTTDEEHRELLVDINELSDLLTRRQSWSLIVAQSRRLRDRCLDHFQDEEGVLERAMYDRLLSHKTEHRLIERQLDSIVAFIADSQAPSRAETEAVLLLRAILVNHFFRHDIAYKAYLSRPRGRKRRGVSKT
jgi:hemerythrin